MLYIIFVQKEKVMSKKLIFITARCPFPATSGRKSVLYNYCQILHDYYSYNIKIITFLEKDDDIGLKPYFINDVVTLKRPNKLELLYNLLRYSLCENWPIQTSMYYSKKNQNIVNHIVKEESPDLLITDMVRTTEYGRGYNGYKIADLDDMLSLRYERQMNLNIEDINPYGAALYNLSSWVQTILSRNIIKKYILKFEAEILKKYEKEVYKIYDRTIFVAKHEAEIINNAMQDVKAISVPLGVDVDYFSELYRKCNVEKDTMVFLGVYSAAHNEAAVLNFCKNILPLIKEKKPSVKFYIVGSNPTKKIVEIQNDNIIVTGKVDDVRKVVGSKCVFVCPLTFGSGIKTKILEAMAMGVPVVTTSIGAENINAEDGVEWFIADTNIIFAEKVLLLLNNERERVLISDNAKKFVEKNFTSKVAKEQLGKVCIGGA